MAEEKVTTIVNGTFEISPEHQPRFTALLTPHLIEQMNEGCVYYSLAIDTVKKDLLRLIEGWPNQKTLDDHLASDSVKAIQKRMAEIPIKNYQMVIYTVTSQTDYAMSATSA
jgi:quinol monooxygenase YgiN